MRRLNALAGSVGLLLLVSNGCGGKPVFPTDVRGGHVKLPFGAIRHCGWFGNPEPCRDVPLVEYDRATCFQPDEWAKVDAYLVEVRNYLRTHFSPAAVAEFDQSLGPLLVRPMP